MQKNHKEIKVGNIVQVLKDYKKYIAGITLIATIAAALYAYLATPIFTAKVLINPPKLTDAGAGIGQSLGIVLGISGGGAGFLGQKTDSDTAIAMIKTRSVNDSIIKKFNLQKYYEQKNIEATRQKLLSQVKFIGDIKSGFLELDVDDKDPKMAANIANYYPVALGELISSVAFKRSNKQLQFYSNQVASSKKQLTQAQNALKMFVQQNGIAAGQQGQMVVGLTTQLGAQLLAAKSQLQAMGLYATPDNPDYKKLMAEVAGIQKQLENISGQAGQNVSQDQFPIPAGLVPELAQQYADLMRQVLLREQVYSLMWRQYEGVNIDASIEAFPVVLQVIDQAVVPYQKSRPRRGRIILIGFFAGFTLACLAFILLNHKRVYISKTDV